MAVALGRQANNWALPVCLAAADACWILIIGWIINSIVLSSAGQINLPSSVVLAGLELAAWVLASTLLNRTALPDVAVQIVSGLLGLAVTIGAVGFTVPSTQTLFSTQWFVSSAYSIIIGMALWFIGGYRASQGVSFNAAYATFRTGLITVGATVLLLTLLATGRVSPIWASLGALPVWFFLWALLALALGNREIVRDEGGKTATGTWALALTASIIAVLLLGTVAGVFGGASLINLAGEIVRGIFSLIVALVYAVLWLVLTAVSFLHINPKPFTPALTPSPTPKAASPLEGKQVHPPANTSQLNLNIPIEVRDIALWVAIALIAIGLIWLFNRGLTRTRKVAKRAASEERESLGSWALLMAQWKSWINRLLRRSQTAVMVTREADLAALQDRPEWSGTLSIRQIYLHLQSLAARVGHPRAPQQTPIEYLSVLSTAMPNLQSDFRDITSAYLEARYGPMPASAPAVRAAVSAWKHAEPLLRIASDSKK